MRILLYVCPHTAAPAQALRALTPVLLIYMYTNKLHIAYYYMCPHTAAPAAVVLRWSPKPYIYRKSSKPYIYVCMYICI